MFFPQLFFNSNVGMEDVGLDVFFAGGIYEDGFFQEANYVRQV